MDEWIYCGEEYIIAVATSDIIMLRNEDVSQSGGMGNEDASLSNVVKRGDSQSIGK